MDKAKQYDEIDLAKIARALWSKLWVIILAAIILGAAAFSISAFVITPMYEAETLLYVNNSSISVGSTSLSISSGELTAAQKLVDTYIVILKSRVTLEGVIEDTGVDYTVGELRGMIYAAPVNNTEIFSITVKDADKYEAEKIANSIAKILPNRISVILDGSSPRIVDSAVVPGGKVSPSITKNTMLGAVIGAFAACAGIVIFVLTDTKIRDAEYLSQTYNLPVLAIIPNLLQNDDESYGYGKKEVDCN